MAEIKTIGSTAGHAQPKSNSATQHASDEVSSPCFAVSNSVTRRRERPTTTGHFTRILGEHCAMNRPSIKASHDHADIETNNACRVGRSVFLHCAYGQQVIANFKLFV